MENKEAVRQGVIDYLASRSNLNIASMSVDVSAVTFKGNEADATVSFAPKGAAPSQGMSMRYTLERKGSKWVVRGRSESGKSPHGMGGGMPGMQGGAMPPMPGGAGAAGQMMPPGHPAVKGSENK